MKSIISIACLLAFASLAQACPDLQGDYMCEQDGQTSFVPVTQSETDGVTTYVMNGDEMIADNVAHPMDSGGMSGTYKAQCKDDKLTITMKAKASQGGQNMSMNVKMVITLIDVGYQGVQTGTMTFNGTTNPVNSTVVCTRE